MSTVGDCRYRQAIPVGGRLNIDTNYGLRRSFLPQGSRRYIPLLQPTAQQVMIDTISDGPTTVFLIGAHTNFAIFFMTHPELKKNVEHIYVMGGGIRSKNPIGCCLKSNTSCKPMGQCGIVGNLFSGYTSNPYAEFNIFGDPFAAYQVFHSGIPITLVPLDATNTIPITEQFLVEFKQHQNTFEAQYCYQTLKFYTASFMWDSFTAGIAISIMQNGDKFSGENDFAVMKYMNLTLVTSNKPYGINDGSNPLFNGRAVPKFNLTKYGVHSGHVQTGLGDPFCLINGSNWGRCEDGYTKEVRRPEAVQVLVATKAKANQDHKSSLNREFFKSFLEVLNLPQQTGRFNLTTEFPYYRVTFYKSNFADKPKGKPVIFDMDMSAGDFLSLIYLLKAPTDLINLKGILVSGNGWADIATIDIIYDVLHMMGRDDIIVGLGSTTALDTPILGCKYVKAIPKGSGGLLDSDTLFGLGRILPRSPRGYTAENSTELRQPSALEVWQSTQNELDTDENIIILTNGPLTNIANIILSDKTASSVIESIYIVGGNIKDEQNEEGNIFTVPSNKYAEFNFFLDPLAAKTVIESDINITLIPLSTQRKLNSFRSMIEALEHARGTPEACFSYSLLSLMQRLKQKHETYHHMDMFLGEILGAFFLVEGSNLSHKVQMKSIEVLSNNNISEDGWIIIGNGHDKLVKIITDIEKEAFYTNFANSLNSKRQSAVIASFDEQKKLWGNLSDDR
ncbi:nucleoside hydrolase 3-like isoform X2 [Carex rostrata]